MTDAERTDPGRSTSTPGRGVKDGSSPRPFIPWSLLVRSSRTHDEQGSALILALVMLTVIGLIVGGALTYAGGSLRASTNAIRPNRASLYAADSALQGAIEYVRDNP